ncbi:MAG: ABC transporter permease [Desulfurococcaceae archaeon]
MKTYILNRIIGSFFVILSVLVINFLIVNLAPGNPVVFMGGETGLVSKEYMDYMMKKWGLDKPIYERLIIYMYNVLRGDLGVSYRYLEPVSKLILERIPTTLMITVPSIVLGFLIGTLLATLSAYRAGTFLDSLLTTLSMIFYSVPLFWLGIVLINIFSVNLKLLPATGMISAQLIGKTGSLEYYLDILKHAVLPITTLTLGIFPAYFRLTKSVVMDQLTEDYVLTLEAIGLPRFKILYKHVLRNALLPAITLLGLQLGFAFAGAAIIENVFAWPGIGGLMLNAISARDYPLIMGIFLFVTSMVVVANIVVDLVYGYLDPRIRKG